MQNAIQGIVSLAGRLLIATIFLMSAVGNKIPNFNGVATFMASKGVPLAQLMLAGAILFLIAGSISIIVGYRARIGATLLFIFLVLATYYFHDFWNVTGEEQQAQMVQFMKNLSMMGTMIFIMANGAGSWSLDSKSLASPKTNP